MLSVIPCSSISLTGRIHLLMSFNLLINRSLIDSLAFMYSHAVIKCVRMECAEISLPCHCLSVQLCFRHRNRQRWVHRLRMISTTVSWMSHVCDFAVACLPESHSVPHVARASYFLTRGYSSHLSVLTSYFLMKGCSCHLSRTLESASAYHCLVAWSYCCWGSPCHQVSRRVLTQSEVGSADR